MTLQEQSRREKQWHRLDFACVPVVFSFAASTDTVNSVFLRLSVPSPPCYPSPWLFASTVTTFLTSCPSTCRFSSPGGFTVRLPLNKSVPLPKKLNSPASSFDASMTCWIGPRSAQDGAGPAIGSLVCEEIEMGATSFRAIRTSRICRYAESRALIDLAASQPSSADALAERRSPRPGQCHS